ncbi:MAG: transcription-repair coupling factor [Eubacteriales bacterium]|nr:transcription-repair coupling factor [Eubacteriales bacterium]
MDILKQLLSSDGEFASLCEGYRKGRTPILVNGVCESVRPLFCAAFSAKTNEKPLVIVPDEKQAWGLKNALAAYGENALVYPARDFVFDNIATASHDFEQERLSVLLKIIEDDWSYIITVPDAVMQYTIPPESLADSVINIRLNMKISPEKLAKALNDAGYFRAESVEGKGQFSKRGGIVDVFSPSAEYPCRIDFFGDEPDSMGIFDTLTQRRIENINSYTCVPVSEIIPSATAIEKAKNAAQGLLAENAAEMTEKVRSELMFDSEQAKNGVFPGTRDKYFSLLHERKTTVMEYLGSKPVILFESRKVLERARAFSWQTSQTIEALVNSGRTEFAYCDVAMFEDTFRHAISSKTVAVDYFMESSRLNFASSYSMITKSAGQLAGGVSVFVEEFSNWLEAGRRILYLASSEYEAGNLREILREHEIPSAAYNMNGAGGLNENTVNIGVIPDEGSVYGFELPTVNFVLLTSGGDIERGNVAKRRKYARKFKKAEKIASYSDLAEGDFIVHANHGIGIYAGLQQLTFEGTVKDYIKINYAGGDVLYVPCGQLDLVSKYIGQENNVKIHKMSSSEWARAKAKVKSAAKDIAKDLITLYAARRAAAGYEFPRDDEYQDEFESMFEYEETEGQLTATSEIKSDMEKPFPMDRLLCGDVGFGKTEVALRAVFKCVSAGKQAAILVPTTILAFQHYRTMLSRFRQFPVRVEMLSRFKAKKEADDILAGLKKGSIDVVVGTHKLLQKGVEFKNLGLLVVDEEQRFGVKHKEKLKEMAKNIDALTLTATPIPRTLNMALTGIRDMSVLEEAPRDRAPVQSYVLEYDEEIIGEAIRRELRRGGQVFYLHNVVETIFSKAGELEKRFPNAVVAVGNGQMSKEELGQVWQSMVDGEIDILVCTTIIETGVDVPNANTLIIEDADRLGLSQLHQIRGRVGRSPRKAYSYFTYRPGALLTEIAAKRLEAIKEFTEFGSGFKIAMRDLEIRGAGNLLGAEQSGNMAAVGYDLYVKILEEAVNNEKGIMPTVKKDCLIEIAGDAYIPESYVFSPKLRIDYYRKIALLDSPEDRDDLVDEMQDRFGDLPVPVTNLMDISLCRNTASGCDIEKITQTGGTIAFYTKECDMEKWSRLASLPEFKGRIMLSPSGKHHFAFKLRSGDNPVERVREILAAYSAILTK